MAGAASSPRLVVASRPAFEINGQEEPRLQVDLIRLEADQDEAGIARLEAVFLNWGRPTRASEPGFLYFDGDVLDLGDEISVRAGDRHTEAVIFAGVITAIEASFPEFRPPEIVVRADDRLMWLRMRQRTRSHELVTDSGMAQRIASDNGLGAEARADDTLHREFWQVNQSELGFLRERARAADARLAEADGRLLFEPRRDPPPGPPITLSRRNELLHFQVCADLAHQRSRVRVHGYSVQEKAGIHAEAGAAEVGAGRTGPGVLDSLGVEAVEDMHLEMPATTLEARTLARSLALARARRFIHGRGVTDGTPSLKVGAEVELTELGPWFSGVYHVASVRHTYDQRDGLRTHFSAERVSLGGDL